MDIRNCTNAINAYQSIGGAKFDADVKKTDGVKKAKNTDKLVLSSSLNNVDGVKASIVKSADTPASAERIAALKNAVAEGKYNVSSDAIANSMLSIDA